MSRSLIGIDVGSSAIKFSAFASDGRLVAGCARPVTSSGPEPGWQIVDPANVLDAVIDGLAELADALIEEPPLALAFSVSGDEVFPVAGDRALGPCLLSGDLRGDVAEAAIRGGRSSEGWLEFCGHVPERMDPVARMSWWRTEHPDVFAAADRFLGWHEHLCLHLCGRAVTDLGLASKWSCFDLDRCDWSEEELARVDFDRAMLPDVLPAGRPLGPVDRRLAEDLGLPDDLIVAVGSYDSSCAALGVGVVDGGACGLACGSWEVVVAPDPAEARSALAPVNASVIRYPAPEGLAALAQSPNGGIVLSWAASVFNSTPGDLEREVAAAGLEPRPVAAFPHFSGAISPWPAGRDLRAGLAGLSLSTSAADIAGALLESVAFDLAITFERFAEAGIRPPLIRAAGGGSASAWWMQLKADLVGLPIETGEALEPGCLGAAILAGRAADAAEGLERAATSQTLRTFRPDPARAELYGEKLAEYRTSVGERLEAVAG